MSRALFWDFDGTLARSDSLWTGSAHSALLDCAPDCGIGREDIRPLMREGFPWHTPEGDFRHLIAPGKWWAFMSRRFFEIYRALGVDEATAAKASARVREFVLDIGGYTLYEDAMPVLEACRRAGWRNFILSNNYPELPEIVSKLGLSPFFSGITVSARAGYDKPRREIFDIALKLAGHPEPCFMIGDNPAADIAGAKAAGIPAILVHKDIPCADADHICGNLVEILGIFKID
jgi:HAD superfamily hydrolase (TIGR01549 family)